MEKENSPNINGSRDFIFRWKLEETKSNKKISRGGVGKFIQILLTELLDVISLTYGGKDLKVDGFRFLNETKIRKIFPKK